MFSMEKYISFKKEVESIIIDTYVSHPTKEMLSNDDYFFQEGLWTNTNDLIYFYDKKKLAKHKSKLLSICKCLPKFHQPTEQHAGTISSFDLLPSTEQLKSQSLDDTFYQLIISNHFANLVCGADIASIAPVTRGKDKAFLIVLDSKYRSYMEREGQEPFDD